MFKGANERLSGENLNFCFAQLPARHLTAVFSTFKIGDQMHPCARRTAECAPCYCRFGPLQMQICLVLNAVLFPGACCC
jgi:hypothetical protein